MTSWADMNDDELLAALGEALTEADDGANERRKQAARAAFTWRSVDTELAELLHDSALDAGAAVRSSAAEEPRSLSFGSGGLSLEVEVDGTDVIGQVVGADVTGATVTLQRTGDADRAVDVDPAGFFRFVDVLPGPVRLVAAAAGWRLVSPWVVL